MHKSAMSRTIAAAVLALGGLAIAGAPAQADDEHGGTVVLMLTTTEQTRFGNNTSPTPGSTFGTTGTVSSHGKPYGTFADVCTVAASDPLRLLCRTGFSTPDGQIESAAFTEGDFRTFPAAVTGGTSKFKNVTGELQFGPSSAGRRVVTAYLNGVRGS